MSMRYGSYKKPPPLNRIPVLRNGKYMYADSDGTLVMPFFPEATDVSGEIRTLNVDSNNRARRTYAATGQWFERSIGGGSARMSPAYTQFAGDDAAPPKAPSTTLARLGDVALGASIALTLSALFGGRKR